MPIVIYALKIEALYTSETLVTTYKNIKCHKQQYYNVSFYCQGYLNSQQFSLYRKNVGFEINVIY